MSELNHYDHTLRELLSNRYVVESVDDVYISAFYYRMEILLSKQLSCSEHQSDSWCNIPLSNREFLNLLKIVYDDAEKRKQSLLSFLDVGCGFGLKCLLAKKVRYLRASGIDVCKSYVDFANLLLQGEEIDVTCVNALDYDGYGKYDIVYMFQPIREREKMRQLLHKVENDMKPRSYLIGRFYTCSPTLDNVGCEVWRKGN